MTGAARNRIRARAPLRLGLAGGGTDVSPFCDEHGGQVMNAAIGLYALVHLSPRDDERLVFDAADVGERHESAAAAALPVDGPALLHKGVYNRFVRQFNDGRPLPVTVTSTVEAPAGSGLGSSSTLVVALVEAFRAYLRQPMGEYDVARLAYEIERHDLGLSGGRQDQYAAAFGGFNFMEFQDGDRVIVNPLRVAAGVQRELESAILLCYSGEARRSASIIDTQKRGMSRADPVVIENLLALKREAVEMKEAILRGDFAAIAATLQRGWAAKKRTAQGVSTDRIDRMIEEAYGCGAVAAKVSGAGGGGFLMLLCDPERRHVVAERLSGLGGAILPCRFTAAGAESWLC
jgi:D-glycero-alpha-D-manno-heptose-7-phosphate kinase